MFNLKVHNFRSFQNQELNFSRINILIGENSGGKSSLLKFLLSLKQTLDSPYEVNLKLKGDYTDLGNFEEVVYNKDKKNKIGFRFASKDEYSDYFIKFVNLMIKEPDVYELEKKLNKVVDVVMDYHNSETLIEFEISNELDNHSSIKTIISNKNAGLLEIIQHENDNDGIQRDLKCDIKYKFLKSSGVIKNCTAFKEGFFTLFGAELKTDIMEQVEDISVDYIYFTFVYLLVFQNYIIEKIDKIKFVNPIGSSPKRFYFQEDKKATYKSIDIEKFINIIGDPTLNKTVYDKQIASLNKIIKEFGIAEEIQIVKEKQLPILALNIKTKNFWSNITDVGYGVSLQIPILFQALLSENYTKKGQTILIEQPEVHLHPSLQAKFIETLLSIGNKNNYFIETHSEHIIRKLQVLVKNKTFGLKPEDVTIHYFKRDSLKFDISEHKIKEDGKLTPVFPNGFYDTSYSLVKELL